ncbi:MAG: sensor histidine kinase, partial [Prolixibacteraceae bacterium]|nr:sensor histidine kinase [Prolixibacteraceae bacterium]
PLNAIIGFTEMLTEDGVSKDKKVEFQKLVGSNTMFLLSTIDDIFDASMANTNQINSVKASFKVNNFLESIFYELNGIIIKYHSKNVSMVPIRLSNNDIEIDTDEFYLKKAFLRLIDNAFKFTLKGSIEVGAKFSKSELEFFVKDSGIGINKDDQEKIFEPFVQGDGSYTRDYGGSGLGLSIVSGIAKELGCYLIFHSEKDKGSTFRLIFQREEPI